MQGTRSMNSLRDLLREGNSSRKIFLYQASATVPGLLRYRNFRIQGQG